VRTHAQRRPEVEIDEKEALLRKIATRGGAVAAAFMLPGSRQL
jgi:Ser/Thr protein kinase RdoA (MazF antagonist)